MSSGACDLLSRIGDGEAAIWYLICSPRMPSAESKYFMDGDDVDTLSLELEPESVHLGKYLQCQENGDLSFFLFFLLERQKMVTV